MSDSLASFCRVASTQQATYHTPLLGVLARQRWFTKMGEPATTQAAAALLKHPELADPLLGWLMSILQIDLPDEIVEFAAEAIDGTGKRPDIVGRDVQGRPRLIIELKFDAKIDVRQVVAYRREQIRHFGTDRKESATLLVVPERRLTKASDAFNQVASLLPDAVRDDDRLAGTGFAPWQEWLGAWDRALDDFPQGRAQVAADVVQFNALCRALLKSTIAPLNDAATSEGWTSRRRDILRLPDLVTSRLNYMLWHDGFERLRGAEIQVPFRSRRTITISMGRLWTDADVGIRTDPGAGLSPLWLRIRESRCDDLGIVRSRIASSRFGASLRHDKGHLWIPIIIPPHLGDDALINSLVNEVLELIDVIGERRPAHPSRY